MTARFEWMPCKRTCIGPGEGIQPVNCLPYKHKNMSFTPRTYIKNMSSTRYSDIYFNPNTLEVGAGRSL